MSSFLQRAHEAALDPTVLNGLKEAQRPEITVTPSSCHDSSLMTLSQTPLSGTHTRSLAQVFRKVILKFAQSSCLLKMVTYHEVLSADGCSLLLMPQ